MPTRKREEGQILVLFALMFLVLVAVIGLVLDGSFAWAKQRQAQNAADLAAIAGANALRSGLSDSAIRAAVDGVVSDNGGTVGTAEYTDANGNPYSPPRYVGSAGDVSIYLGVKVTTVQTWTPFLPAIWGNTSASAGAGGTARFTKTAGTAAAAPCGLCAIGSTYPAIDISAGGGLTINASHALSNAGIKATSGGSLAVSGTGASVYYHGDLDIGGGTVTPAPQAMAAKIVDPLAFLSDPVASGTSYAAVDHKANQSPNPRVLNPGIYPSIKTSSNGTITLNPGTYYITNSDNSGTGLNCKANATLNGAGVTLVFLGQSPFNPESGCVLNLSAPAPSLTPTAAVPYPGLLVYYARTNTSVLSLSSGSTTNVSGSIYAKTGTVWVQGGSVSGKAFESMVVVNNIVVKANSYFKAAYVPSLNVPMPAVISPVLLVQ